MAKQWTAGDQLLASDLNQIAVPTGTVVPYMGRTVSATYWLLCDGTAVSRATYSDLFAVLFPTIGTFTITIAAPGRATLNAHGLATGDGVYITTTGALPTGLAANTRYWIIKDDADHFWLATSLSNALAGTKITTTGSQSGTHTLKLAPCGIGDGSTTFNLPNMVGTVPVGKNQSDAEFAGLGQTGGAKTHTLTSAEMPSHHHEMNNLGSGGGGSGTRIQLGTGGGGSYPTGDTGGGGAHNNLQPYFSINFIIKY